MGSAAPTAQYYTGISDAEDTAADTRDARTGTDLELESAPFLSDMPVVQPAPPGVWPAIPTTHPAPNPYPWHTPVSPEREQCHGVGNNKLGELPSVAAEAPMAFMNRPQLSEPYAPFAEGDFVTSDGRGAQRNDGWCMPRNGRLEDLYLEFAFCPRARRLGRYASAEADTNSPARWKAASTRGPVLASGPGRLRPRNSALGQQQRR